MDTSMIMIFERVLDFLDRKKLKIHNKVSHSFPVGCFVILVFANAFALPSTALIEHDKSTRYDKKNISPLIHLSGKNNQIAVQVFPNMGSSIHSKWRVLRHYPTGKIEIQYNEGVAFKPILLPPGFTSDAYIMLTFGDPNKPHLLVYNVVRNIPSGRQLTPKEPGYDLYQLDANIKPELKLITQGINIGGLDTLVYGHIVNTEVHVCATNQCITVLPDGSKVKWNTENLSHYEFIELTFHNNKAYALVRLHHDDRFDGQLHDGYAKTQLAKLTPDQAEINDINPHCLFGIPYNLRLSETGKLKWDIANSAKSFRSLLLYDLGRMPNHGWMDFAANNLEGRIAWSQVYYLSGMISLLNKNSGLQYIPNNNLRENISQTILEELNLLAGLSSYDYPGYLVKRYSIDREPLIFALHLSRIVMLLKRTQTIYKHNGNINKAILSICTELNNLNHTVEKLDEQDKSQISMSYKLGYPFWADGVNVPYNYISGYVQGILKACNSDKTVKISAALIKPLLSEVQKNTLIWRYWGSVGDNGWAEQDRISINTPAWDGNKHAKAHITYRTMDASAILALYQVNPKAIANKNKILKNIQTLTRHGLLLPSINEELHNVKIPIVLDEVTAKYYARSTALWEIPSQIWALEALAKTKINQKGVN
jgi:hypothetical protein